MNLHKNVVSLGVFLFIVIATFVSYYKHLDMLPNVSDHYSPIYISSNEEFKNQVKLNKWSGKGTEKNPFIIKNLHFSGKKVEPSNYNEYLIEIRNTNLHFMIISCIIKDGLNGILFSNVNNSAILNSTIIRNEGAGIHFSNVRNSRVENSSITQNLAVGIYLDSVEDNSFNNNIITSNGIGINADIFYNTIISENYIAFNYVNGILINKARFCNFTKNFIAFNRGTGLDLSYAKNNFISINYIINNGIISVTTPKSYGVRITFSQNNTLNNNHLFNNSRFGIIIFDSAFNKIINNDFINNTGEITQAYEKGIPNLFNFNYWNEWMSPDSDINGIVDIPYYIEGNTNNKDGNPLVNPNS